MKSSNAASKEEMYSRGVLGNRRWGCTWGYWEGVLGRPIHLLTKWIGRPVDLPTIVQTAA